jgi:AraC-like DNA-binding protein
MENILKIKSISELHRLVGCSPPKHPAISFLNFEEMTVSTKASSAIKVNIDLYIISLKSGKGKLKYGRTYYDFDEGTLLFTAPNQVLHPSNLIDDMEDTCGWSLIFHPDLIRHSGLGKKMNQYKFFTYESNEALHLSEDEKNKLLKCIDNIKEEYSQNLDQHSQSLIITNLELLLNYINRFYGRQFLTRSPHQKDIVSTLENLLRNYFESDKPLTLGLPTVKYCAAQVHLSPNYLSDLLKEETGKTTKEHIDFYLLEKAKDLLLGTQLNINEIAYDLGFEYSKSFGKLFKKKMGITPKAFRQMN